MVFCIQLLPLGFTFLLATITGYSTEMCFPTEKQVHPYPKTPNTFI